MSANVITWLDDGAVSERPRSKQGLDANPGHGRQIADVIQKKPNPAAGLNDSDWRGCRKFVPVLGRDGTKMAPSGDIFDQPLGEMSCILSKLANYVGYHVVLYPEGVFW